MALGLYKGQELSQLYTPGKMTGTNRAPSSEVSSYAKTAPEQQGTQGAELNLEAEILQTLFVFKTQLKVKLRAKKSNQIPLIDGL